MLVDWSDALAIGDDVIDRGHVTLIQTLNKLTEAVAGNYSKNMVELFLSQFTDRVSRDFIYEEQLMRRHKYSEVAEHIREHSNIINDIGKFIYEFEASPYKINPNIIFFVKSRIISHIKCYDHKFGNFLRSCTN